jgi:hypothetical protein
MVLISVALQRGSRPQANLNPGPNVQITAATAPVPEAKTDSLRTALPRAVSGERIGKEIAVGFGLVARNANGGFEVARSRILENSEVFRGAKRRTIWKALRPKTTLAPLRLRTNLANDDSYFSADPYRFRLSATVAPDKSGSLSPQALLGPICDEVPPARFSD